MLVLSRKEGEALILELPNCGEVKIRLLEYKGSQTNMACAYRSENPSRSSTTQFNTAPFVGMWSLSQIELSDSPSISIDAPSEIGVLREECCKLDEYLIDLNNGRGRRNCKDFKEVFYRP